MSLYSFHIFCDWCLCTQPNVYYRIIVWELSKPVNVKPGSEISNSVLRGGSPLLFREFLFDDRMLVVIYSTVVSWRDLGRRVNQHFEGRPNFFRRDIAEGGADITLSIRFYEFVDGFNEVTSVHLTRGVLWKYISFSLSSISIHENF